jgi:nucleotide-binding universal stress UspA family protein
MEDDKMYKTILAPLDGSKRAEAILPHIEGLARNNSSKVIFMQVVEPVMLAVGPDFAFQTQEEYEVLEKQAEDYLAGLKGEFREKGINARIFITHGPVVEAIIRAAESENADLIAVASHGRTGLSRVFYGSVAAGVLHRIDRPLLLVRSV